MSPAIDPRAAVDPGARLADGVVVGAFAVIGEGVEVGERTQIGAGATILGPAKIGRENRIYPHACLGTDPQDLKYGGERVTLEVGDRNLIREFVTIHRGTAKGGGVTRVGSDNLFMVYSHVAHDCQVGDRTIFANNATLAGHCEVHDDATIGAFSALQPFGRIGRHAYIGGFTRLLTDPLPFVKTIGLRPVVLGVNRIGMTRKGYDVERVRQITAAVRIFLRSGLNSTQAIARLESEFAGQADVAYFVEFVRAARRGVVRALPGRHGDDAGDGDE